MDGYLSSRRTDRAELEKHHEGLTACSARIAGKIPDKSIHGDIDGAREATPVVSSAVFGDDLYLEPQRHEVSYPMILCQSREAFPAVIAYCCSSLRDMEEVVSRTTVT